MVIKCSSGMAWTDLCLGRRLDFCILSYEELKLLVSYCLLCRTKTQAQLKWAKERNNVEVSPLRVYHSPESQWSVFYAVQTITRQAKHDNCCSISVFHILPVAEPWWTNLFLCRKWAVGYPHLSLKFPVPLCNSEGVWWILKYFSMFCWMEGCDKLEEYLQFFSLELLQSL